MAARRILAFWAICFWLPTFNSPSAAATAVPDSQGAISLDEICRQLANEDESMRGKAAAFLGAMDAEIAAHRFSAGDSEGLRSAAQLIATTMSSDARTLLASVRLPLGNETLMKAVQDVELEAVAIQIRRDKLTSQAMVETRRRARELIAKAESPVELESFIVSLKALAGDAALHSSPGERNTAREAYENLAGLFRALSLGISAGANQDSKGIAKALADWGILYSDVNGMLSYDERQEIRARIFMGPELEIERAKHALEASMAEWRPAPELSAALERFQKASDVLRGLSFDNPGFIPDLYRKAVSVEIGLETSYEAGMEQKVSEVRKTLHESISWVVAARCEGLQRFLNVLDDAIRDARAKAANERRMALLTAIRNIKSPAELEALCAEFNVAESEGASQERSDGGNEDGRAGQVIVSQLVNLATTARAGDFSSTDNSLAIRAESEARMAIEDIRNLRDRLERQAISQRLHAAELTLLPLSDLPLSSALNALYKSAADSADWRRALAILEIQDSPNFVDLRSPRSKDSAISIRAFLAGQNLEVAEQWTDAVASYNTVLRRAVALTPVPDSAERIKLIRKAHPDAFASIHRQAP